jgi:hypothetical protein
MFFVTEDCWSICYFWNSYKNIEGCLTWKTSKFIWKLHVTKNISLHNFWFLVTSKRHLKHLNDRKDSGLKDNK